MHKEYALNTVAGLSEFWKDQIPQDRATFIAMSNEFSTGDTQEGGTVYCPKCCLMIRVRIQAPGLFFHNLLKSRVATQTLLAREAKNKQMLAASGDSAVPETEPREAQFQLPVPTLFSYTCLQCGTVFAALLYAGPDGPDVVVLANERGGIKTPHTPDGVGYYTDQAGRCIAVGARTAALAMYRSALEQLLFEQGFTQGMLDKKVRDLDTAVQQKKAPAWANDLDTEFLDLLKRLGNGSIHPNGGDIKKQAAIDDELLGVVHEVFADLLDAVYEQTHRKNSALGKLKNASNVLRK